VDSYNNRSHFALTQKWYGMNLASRGKLQTHVKLYNNRLRFALIMWNEPRFVKKIVNSCSHKNKPRFVLTAGIVRVEPFRVENCKFIRNQNIKSYKNDG